MTTAPPTLWLSCHVHYACRHSGACCRSAWPLPVDARVVPRIDAAVADGHVGTVDGNPAWLIASADAPEGVAGVFRTTGDACVFHVDRGGSAGHDRHCAVHTALGHEALPASCQHFPRVCLVDDRGVRVALSHYCPTAAELLCAHDGPLEIVEGPTAVQGRLVPEGLDVRDSLPPRLTPDVLMDLDALTAWEALVVQLLAGPNAPDGTPAEALALVRSCAEQLVLWSPGGASSLSGAVTSLGASTMHKGASGARGVLGSDGGPYRPERQRRAMRVVSQACRAPWTWPDVPDDLEDLDRDFVASHWPLMGPTVRRYLAAKAFGAWVTYQADAARSLVRWLQLAHDVLRVESAKACGVEKRPLDDVLLLAAVRRTDLLLVHYADSLSVARAL